MTEVDPTSPAYEAGVQTGDVILEINRDPIKNAQDAVNDTAKPMGNETLVKFGGKGGFTISASPTECRLVEQA